jgi:hypothetical protein
MGNLFYVKSRYEHLGRNFVQPSASSSSQAQITQAIGILQDAVRKGASDPKAVRADVVKAANILLEILGLKGVANDPGGGGN